MPEIELGGVDGGSRRLRGYVARPDGSGPWPGVVAIHEAFGLEDVMRRQADRLAQAGYLALLPDLYSDGGAARCVLGTIRSLIAGKGKPFADIEAARQWLLGQGDCTGRVGVIGFCMGGAFAIVVADTGFDVASVNYGPLPPKLGKVLEGACPIVGSYGAKEIGAAKSVRRLERTLTELDIDHDIKLYPRAGHSFLNDAVAGPAVLRPLLRIAQLKPEPESAADAWQRIEAFFEKYLR